MKYLVLIMFLVGCGADPDDFKVQESDGCRSDDIECKAQVDNAIVDDPKLANGWTREIEASANEICVEDASLQVDNTNATMYCSCAVDAAANRFKYADYAADEEMYVSLLEDLGELQKCREKTKIADTSAVTVNTTIIVENQITVGPKGDTIKAESAANCTENKLCRGLTKQQVIDLVGEPKTISKRDPWEVWDYSDYTHDNPICPAYQACTVTFRNGLLVDQKNVRAELIDLINF